MPVAIARGGGEHVGQRPHVGSQRIGVDPQPLDEREHLQQREALAVRRHHAHVQVSVAADQRGHQVGGVRRQVLGGHGGAGRAQPGRVTLAERPPVEGPGSVGGEQLQRGAERRLPQERASGERLAVGEEHVADAVVGLQPGGVALQRSGERPRYRHAAVRERDRRAERLAPRQPRALIVQGRPAAHRARDGDGVGPELRHVRAVRGAERIGVDAGGSPPARVDRDRLPVGPLHQREQVAAHAAVVRVADRERDRGRERGVQGVPSAFERHRSGLGRGRVGCGDRPGRPARPPFHAAECGRLAFRRSGASVTAQARLVRPR